MYLCVCMHAWMSGSFNRRMCVKDCVFSIDMLRNERGQFAVAVVMKQGSINGQDERNYTPSYNAKIHTALQTEMDGKMR